MARRIIYLVILNYNNWRDTIVCLESVFRLKTSVRVVPVLVDNDSTDGSASALTRWMEGHEKPTHTLPESYAGKGTLISKPLRVLQWEEDKWPTSRSEDVQLCFIRSSFNRGYAGGNNLGIRYGQSVGDADFFWILNNDTVLPEDSLEALLQYHDQLSAKGRKPGIIGSKLRFHDTPEMLHAMGVRFNPWRLKHSVIGAFEEDQGQYDKGVEIDYPFGASLFVSNTCVETTGLMEEGYFLYYEELDWCLRSHRKGFQNAVAPASIVFHKQGVSTNSSAKSQKKSLMAMFYKFRNPILLYRKHFPWLLPISVVVVVWRILKWSFTIDRAYLRLLLPVLTLQKRYSPRPGER